MDEQYRILNNKPFATMKWLGDEDDGYMSGVGVGKEGGGIGRMS